MLRRVSIKDSEFVKKGWRDVKEVRELIELIITIYGDLKKKKKLYLQG